MRSRNLVFAVTLFAAAPVVAQEPATVNGGSQPGDVIVDFRGGNAGQTMADALAALASQDGVVRTVDVVVESGDNVCSLLTRRKFPPACTSMIPLIARMNPDLGDLAKLKPGDHIQMPDIRIEVRPASRNVSEQERKLASRKVIFNWAGMTVRTVLGQSQISYSTYKMYVPNPSDEAARRTLGILKQGVAGAANVTFDIALYTPLPAPLHSGDGAMVGCPAIMFRYADMMDSDSGLSPFVPPPTASRPTVFLIDTILNPTPDLYGSTQPATCLTVPFDSARHHATLLAGIIASASKARFAGLAPESNIVALDWVRPDADSPEGMAYIPSPNTALTGDFDRIGDDTSLNVRPIFLAATSFPVLDDSQIADIASDPKNREGYAPNVPIFDQKPLIIASAGQRGPGDTAPFARISTNYAFSPQNLGDLDNVVLVTACTECRAGQVKILADAFRPAASAGSTITLVAPGGSPVPGWVDANSVSSAAGTSQAAAFVAGVAAGMISRYPAVYQESWRVKYWLSATSWPLVRGVGNDEAASVVEIGLLDAQRALLDPGFAYAKDRSGAWQKLRLRRWLQPSLKVQDSGAQMQDISISEVARIVKVAGAGSVAKYAILRKPGATKRLERIGWRTFVGKYALERCDGGPPIQLDQLDDLIMPLNRLQTRTPCG